MKKLLLSIGLALTLTTNAQVPSYVPTSGLVGYWPFNGNANDISTNANNGVNNGATLTTDRFGNANSAYSFDGSTSKIKVTHNNSLNAFPITISVWCKSQSSMGGIVSKYGGCSNNGWQIHSSFNKISGYYYNLPGGSYVNFDGNSSSSQDINDNTWHHVVETYDSTGGKLYLDGNLIISEAFSGSGAPSFCSTLTDLYFGYRTPGTPGNCVPYNFFFQGIIDDIGIWNRVLTPNEITNLYNANICYQSITVTDTLIINTGILSYNPVTYNNTVTIYPNPAKDHITIDCGNLTNVVGHSIKITNTLGQEVFNQQMNAQQFYVPLNTWTGQGLYFVNIIDAQGHIIDVRKIILQ